MHQIESSTIAAIQAPGNEATSRVVVVFQNKTSVADLNLYIATNCGVARGGGGAIFIEARTMKHNL